MKAKQEVIVQEREKQLAKRLREKEREIEKELEAKKAEKQKQKQQIQTLSFCLEECEEETEELSSTPMKLRKVEESVVGVNSLSAVVGVYFLWTIYCPSYYFFWYFHYKLQVAFHHPRLMILSMV